MTRRAEATRQVHRKFCLAPKELAKRMGVSAWWIRKLVRDGLLPAFKESGETWIPRREAMAALQEQKRGIFRAEYDILAGL